jgi:hypothetical protein
MENPCVRSNGLFDKAIIPCGVETWEYHVEVNKTVEEKLRYSLSIDELIEVKIKWKNWYN